jgi:S1-C subfamily serine protease
MTIAEEFQAGAVAVAGRVGPAVVRIGRGPGRGAGVVIAKDQVLTNAHNLRDATTTVTFADGRSLQGSLTAADPTGDLAVLAVETADVTPVEWGTSGSVSLGSPVWSVVTTPGGGTRVTFGTVSGVSRSFRGPKGHSIHGGIEHTAAASRGSSGSPIVDGEGRLVGLNTHRLGDGFYLAQEATASLKERVEALGRGELPKSFRLGVAIAPADAARRLRSAVGLEDRPGLLIREVDASGPAARAGLRRGDLIVGGDGNPISNPDQLFDAVRRGGESGSLNLTVVRGADDLELTVTFGDTDAPGGGEPEA